MRIENDPRIECKKEFLLGVCMFPALRLSMVTAEELAFLLNKAGYSRDDVPGQPYEGERGIFTLMRAVREYCKKLGRAWGHNSVRNMVVNKNGDRPDDLRDSEINGSNMIV